MKLPNLPNRPAAGPAGREISQSPLDSGLAESPRTHLYRGMEEAEAEPGVRQEMVAVQ